MLKVLRITLALMAVLALGTAFWGCGEDKKPEETAVQMDEHDFPVSVNEEVGKMHEHNGVRTMVVESSSYTTRPQETKNHAPGVAAWGDKLEPGMKAIAVSRDLIPLGLTHNVKVKIKGLPGEWRVLDKMNKRWTHKIDIYFGEDVAHARKWGKRKVRISWPAPDKKG